jgi:hypothetical protein
MFSFGFCPFLEFDGNDKEEKDHCYEDAIMDEYFFEFRGIFVDS